MFEQKRKLCVEAISSGKCYFKKNSEGHYELDKGHVYWHQVQGQLY